MSAPARTSERGRWRVEWFSTLDSTNRHALDAARDGAPAGLVVVADEQTAGRGRLGRTWEARPGSSLLVSVLLRDPGDPARAVMAAGVALAAAVEDVAGIEVGLKWPNDLVVDDRKLAGLLAEAEGDALVVGAGCNVNWESFPEELRATATACNLEAGRPVDHDALLDAFLDRFAAALGRMTGSSTTTGRGSPRSAARCASSTCATPIWSAPRSASPPTAGWSCATTPAPTTPSSPLTSTTSADPFDISAALVPL